MQRDSVWEKELDQWLKSLEESPGAGLGTEGGIGPTAGSATIELASGETIELASGETIELASGETIELAASETAEVPSARQRHDTAPSSLDPAAHEDVVTPTDRPAAHGSEPMTESAALHAEPLRLPLVAPYRPLSGTATPRLTLSPRGRRPTLANPMPPSGSTPSDPRASASFRAASGLKHSPEADMGAATALRTVAYRRPADENLPLVGQTPEAWRARRALLENLASTRSGRAKAKLLVAAAEIAESLSETEAALALFVQAHEADPKELIALRALRRDASTRGDWTAVASSLQSESGLALPDWERSFAFCALAEIHLRRFSDAATAEKAARAAVSLRRDSVAAHLILAETCFAQGRDAEAWRAIETATECLKDDATRAALLVDNARALERRGQTKRAAESYAHAYRCDPRSVDVLLGVARTGRAAGEHAKAVHAALLVAEGFESPAIREAFRTLAAQWLHFLERRPADAKKLLQDGQGVAALRTLAQVARESGDTDSYVAALVELSEAAGGIERALAFSELAEVYIGNADAAPAASALIAAAKAAPELPVLEVLRHVGERRLGNPAWRSSTGDQRPSTRVITATLAAAAVADQPAQLELEITFLQQIPQTRGHEATTAILLDASNEIGRSALTRQTLHERLHSTAGAHDTGVAPLGHFLTLFEFERKSSSNEDADAVLRQAREAHRNSALPLRAQARMLYDSAPLEAAQCWLEASVLVSGSAAAADAHQAALLLASKDKESFGALQRALECEPQYAPSFWRTTALLAARHDFDRLADLHQARCQTDISAEEQAMHRSHAALAVLEANPARSTEILTQLAEKNPQDRLAYELLLRACEGLSIENRSVCLKVHAEAASRPTRPGGMDRDVALRAAMSQECWALLLDGDDARVAYRSAAEIYRKLVDASEQERSAAIGLWRSEVAADMFSEAGKRRRDAVQSAATPQARLAALESLIDFDLHVRREAETAAASLQALLRLVPSHVPALHALQGHYMQQKRDRDLLRIEEKWSEVAVDDGGISMHARLSARLRLRLAEGDATHVDTLANSIAERLANDLWFVRRAEHGARYAADWLRVAQLDRQIAGQLDDVPSRGAFYLRATEAAQHAGGPKAAIEFVEAGAADLATYPTAAGLVGRLLETSEKLSTAAEAYERAAQDGQTSESSLLSWYRAAVLWQDKIGDKERALLALRAVATIDLCHLDTLERLMKVLQQTERLPELAEWIDARLRLGGDRLLQLRLQRSRADLSEKLGDQQALQTAMLAMLDLENDEAANLQSMAQLAIRNRLWPLAGECLERLGRVGVDRQQLRWSFLQLGSICEDALNDLAKAEEAYGRALSLDPNDTEASQKLGENYRRQGKWDRAAEFYEKLIGSNVPWEQKRSYSFALAATRESQQRHEDAEAVLESARKLAPADWQVIECLADFYHRQGAPVALTRHLERAVEDYRRSIAQRPLHPDHWKGLVRVLQRLGHDDAAASAASSAATLRIVDVELAKLVDAAGDVPGCHLHLPSDEIDAFLAPPEFQGALRRVVYAAAEALERLLPLDLQTLGAQKLPKTPLEVREIARAVAKQLGCDDLQLWVTDLAPRMCLCVSGDPLEVVLGRDWLQADDPRQQAFLLTRAAIIGRTRLSVIVSAPPEQLGLALDILLHSFMPSYAPPRIAPDQLAKLAKQMHKALGRRERAVIESSIAETAEVLPNASRWLGAATNDYASRAALLACGSVASACQALLRVAGETIESGDSDETRLAKLQRVPEAWSLLLYSLSPHYFEARARSGRR